MLIYITAVLILPQSLPLALNRTTLVILKDIMHYVMNPICGRLESAGTVF